MKEYVRISYDKLGMSIVAEVLTDLNPVASERFLASMPYRSVQSHATSAGEQMYCPYKLIVDHKDCNTELMSNQPDGRINIELDFQYLSINYGRMTEAVPAVPIAQVIPEDIPKLAVIGKAAWNNLLYEHSFIIVRFERIGGAVQ